jgi:alkanesulfonate monooxygenase SsuD/methylene tetrahydromethanopterin reductase-like flavin-dependent oxidoreductase (luciferase family)
LRLSGIPAVADLPIYLAALGPKNLQLAGELCDGWLATFYSPEHAADQHAAWRSTYESRERARPFEVVATVPAVVHADLSWCADQLRPFVALYVGGMGSREQNFYNARAHRMGHGDAVDLVQDLYLSGQRHEAELAVPETLIDQISLLGPWERVAERLVAFAESGVTTLSVAISAGSLSERLHTLELLAQAADAAGLER